jgi:hypothetical protein
MADTLRVYPVQSDGYGKVIEYPQYAGYRFEPHEPGLAGDSNHDLVVYRKPTPGTDEETKELGRHRITDVLIVFPGQPSPVTEDMTVSDGSRQSSKTGQPAKTSNSK